MNDIKILDLRFKGKLPSAENIIFNEIAITIKDSFNDIINYLSKPNMDNIDWWVNELPSRNTYSSPFFHYYCCIHLVDYLSKKRKINYKKIIVDSKSLKIIIKAILLSEKFNDVDIIYKKDLKSIFNIFIKKYFGQLIVFIYNILKYIIAKQSKTSQNIISKNSKLILIDTFILDGYTDSKRWYGKLWNSISENNKNNIYFVSSILKVSLWKLNSIYKKIRSNNENYIIKEDYIKISDLIFAYSYKKRLKSLIIKTIKVSGVNITSLAKECINNPIEIFSIQESLLTYKFIERLKKKNISIKLSIDWFEGQIIDKAWNLAFHKFFSNVNTVAYRPFEVSPLYLCAYPISIEVQAGVVPKVFALQGVGSIRSLKYYSSNLDTILIPSYKSNYVWEKRKISLIQNSNIILIALPIVLQAGKNIILKIINLVKTYPEIYSDYLFVFKVHPTKSAKLYFSGKLPKNIKFTDERSFPLLLRKSKVLITEASMTCLESIATGVPAILIKREDGLFYNPLSNEINKILFKICSSLDQLNKALIFYLSMNEKEIKRIISEGHKVRNDYFEPITDKGTKKFLNIN